MKAYSQPNPPDSSASQPDKTESGNILLKDINSSQQPCQERSTQASAAKRLQSESEAMPYFNRIEDLPERVRESLPEHARHIFMKAFNNAWEQYKEPEKRRGGAAEPREEVAFKVAWAAVEKEYKKDESEKWVKREEAHEREE